MKKIYWLLLLILILAQTVSTFHAMSYVRYEELAESVRNPFWLQNRTLYDGVSGSVSWYAGLLLIYKLFGFSLYTGKILRLLLWAVSLFCLASLLKKYLGVRLAWLPLLTIGLSPTILFFNTVQTTYGMDFQYLPIILWLLVNNRLILLGIVSMLAWLSYPTFVFYLPFLGILLWKLKGRKVAGALAGFITPLVLTFLYIKDIKLLILDPKTHSGLFRGAGFFYFNFANYIHNLSSTLGDLFNKAGSYYFEVSAVEFSHFFPVISVVLVFIIGVALAVYVKKARIFLCLTFGLLITTLIFANLTFDPSGYPGIRRSTPILASFYILFIFIWYFLIKARSLPKQLKYVLVTILLIIPIHHLLVYPINLAGLSKPSPYVYPFNLDVWVQTVQTEDLKMACQDKSGKLLFCRYAESYAGVAGSCLWNHLNCHQILGYDGKTEKFIPLTTKLWEDYYWEH